MNAPAASQIRLVIVGATGMVGGYALRYALDHPSVGVVTVIGRRKLGISHPKLKEVLHPDFGDCFALAKPLSDQDAAIFCLGVYTGAVPDAEFRKITVDYTIEFSRVLRASSPGAAFSFLSGSGADQTEQSRTAFARYKGKAEKALLAAGFPPSLYLPASVYLSRGTPKRTEPQLPAVARDLPSVSDALAKPGNSRRRFGKGHGERCSPRKARKRSFREQGNPGNGRAASSGRLISNRSDTDRHRRR
jgi:uncharacterized protein YbjT (DUF2867 family)